MKFSQLINPSFLCLLVTIYSPFRFFILYLAPLYSQYISLMIILLSVLPQYITYNDKEGNIDTTKLSEKVLQELLPWSDKLAVKCHKTRR